MVTAIVLVPVHVDRDVDVLALEANPRASSALFVWSIGHVFVLLENLLDAVVSDAEVVSHS